MIEKTWNTKDEEMWCCFADFKKAFDIVAKENYARG